MTTSPRDTIGADDVIKVLVENSELAYEDNRALIAAINAQSDLIRQLSSDINSLKQQQNTTPSAPHVSLYQPDTKVIQLDGVRPIDAAITWLRENDPELKLTAREAAIRANMSQATINRAQQKLRK